MRFFAVIRTSEVSIIEMVYCISLSPLTTIFESERRDTVAYDRIILLY